MTTHIRWMIRRDMAEVLHIEQQSYDPRWAWNEEDFVTVLRRRNVIGMVVEHAGRIVGFMLYELYPKRIDLLNFAVAADMRRIGIGSRMVKKLVDKLASHQRKSLTLTIRESNLVGQLFFRSNGFKASKVKRGYYEEDTHEDAYLMKYQIEQHACSIKE